MSLATLPAYKQVLVYHLQYYHLSPQCQNHCRVKLEDGLECSSIDVDAFITSISAVASENSLGYCTALFA